MSYSRHRTDIYRRITDDIGSITTAIDSVNNTQIVGVFSVDLADSMLSIEDLAKVERRWHGYLESC